MMRDLWKALFLVIGIVYSILPHYLPFWFIFLLALSLRIERTPASLSQAWGRSGSSEAAVWRGAHYRPWWLQQNDAGSDSVCVRQEQIPVGGMDRIRAFSMNGTMALGALTKRCKATLASGADDAPRFPG
jgi:hypothetical protein